MKNDIARAVQHAITRKQNEQERKEYFAANADKIFLTLEANGGFRRLLIDFNLEDEDGQAYGRCIVGFSGRLVGKMSVGLQAEI